MKIMALLLALSFLLLLPAQPVKALSLNHNLAFTMNSQYLSRMYAPVDNRYGTEAVPDINSNFKRPDLLDVDLISYDSSAYTNVDEQSVNYWIKNSKTQAPVMVPEPATLILMGGGLLGLAGLNRRWIRQNH